MKAAAEEEVMTWLTAGEAGWATEYENNSTGKLHHAPLPSCMYMYVIDTSVPQESTHPSIQASEQVTNDLGMIWQLKIQH